jgi:hypothetical protein
MHRRQSIKQIRRDDVVDKTILERYAKYTNSDQGDMARELLAVREARKTLLEALKAEGPIVAVFSIHHAVQDAVQDAKTESDYDKATTPDGWHPEHREIYEKLKSAIALLEKER